MSMFNLTKSITRLSIGHSAYPSLFAIKPQPFSTAFPAYNAAVSKTKAKTTKAKSKAKPKPKTASQLKKEARPKRPGNTFCLYVKEMTKGGTLESFGSSATEKVKQLSQEWASVDYATKQKYKAMREELLKEYNTALEAWKAEFPPAKKPYTEFIKAKFHENGFIASSVEDARERVKALSKQWNNLTQQEKDAFK